MWITHAHRRGRTLQKENVEDKIGKKKSFIRARRKKNRIYIGL